MGFLVVTPARHNTHKQRVNEKRECMCACKRERKVVFKDREKLIKLHVHYKITYLQGLCCYSASYQKLCQAIVTKGNDNLHQSRSRKGRKEVKVYQLIVILK